MNAVIDIGSNSVRLLLYEGAPVTQKLLNSTRLADGLALTGTLSNEAMARTKDAVCQFVRLAKEKNAENIYIFATEAMRSAKNGRDFALVLEQACGIKIDIVSGKDEAMLGLLGVLDDDNNGKEYTVIDIGGASVEIIKGDEKRIYYAKSAPLGMVRIQGLVSSEQEIEDYIRSSLPVYGIVSGHEGVAIGGTATALASMDLAQTEYIAQEVHGHTLTLSALYSLRRRIFSSDDIMRDFPTLSKNRAKVIGHGVITLICILEYLGLDNITVSERDNMEGYLKYIKSV